MPGLKAEKQSSQKQEKGSSAAPTEKDKKIARDLVKLKHVETQVQKPMSLSATLKEKIKQEGDTKEKLPEDAFAAISAISESKRLLLQRIQIIVNQSRVPFNKVPLKEDEIRDLMNDLVKKGIVTVETVTTEGFGPREVYAITDKGKELLE